jgi:MFS family permease
MFRKFLGESGIARRDFSIVCILLLSVFGWYYMTLTLIDTILDNPNITDVQTIVWTAYYASVIVSGIVGYVLSKKIVRPKLLYLWTILGIVSSLFPVLFSNFTAPQLLITSIFLGVSFGLGMPSCLAYFADYTIIENRGRVGGIILLIINLSVPILTTTFTIFGLTLISIILVIWRGMGLIIFFVKPKKELPEKTKSDSFTSIFHNRTFLLYFGVWFMFCLVDRFETPFQINFLGDANYLIVMLGSLLASFFAFFGGVLSDWVGRKRVVLYGFATLGISYAIITIVTTGLFSRYFFLTIGSISTGMLWVVFLLIIWGDLAQSGTKEKYYLIGEIPLFLASILQQFLVPYVASIPATNAFSLAAIFLFLAVFPLLYASETLPEKKIELRRLRSFAEDAKKAREKYERKRKG